MAAAEDAGEDGNLSRSTRRHFSVGEWITLSRDLGYATDFRVHQTRGGITLTQPAFTIWAPLKMLRELI